MTPLRIGLFGIFGVENLGNECTLQAMAYNVRRWLPSADVYAASYNPEDTSRRHRLQAVAVSAVHSSRPGRNLDRRGTLAKAAWLMRILCWRIPAEMSDWLRIYKVLRGTDLLFMTGTGMLTDYSGSALGYPYDIFKWAVVGRCARCRVRFVGVGAGPIYEKLSRFLLKTALTLADYRSYRDHVSEARLRELGLCTNRDPIVPDLAFSLPASAYAVPESRPRGQALVVGLGVMNYFDRRASGAGDFEVTYNQYLERMCEFIRRLSGLGFRVRLLQGDTRYDAPVRRDLKERLTHRLGTWDHPQIDDEDIHSVEELLTQMAATDIVVSPRFHNLVLAVMLGKPAISLSYDPKSDALLEAFGLREYCQRIHTIDVERLLAQVLELARCTEEIQSSLRRRTEEYRSLLDRQYDRIFAVRPSESSRREMQERRPDAEC